MVKSLHSRIGTCAEQLVVKLCNVQAMRSKRHTVKSMRGQNGTRLRWYEVQTVRSQNGTRSKRYAVKTVRSHRVRGQIGTWSKRRSDRAGPHLPWPAEPPSSPASAAACRENRGQISIQTGQISIHTGQISIQTGQNSIQTGQISIQTGQISIQRPRQTTGPTTPVAE